MALMVGAGPFTWPAQGQGKTYTPYQHRAWYIYLISQYTQWPAKAFASDGSPFVIGILGKDPFEKDIEIIKDKLLNKRPVRIQYCDTVDEAKICHALYIADSEQDRLPAVMSAIAGQPILTFSEAKGFLEQQGIVKLWLKAVSTQQGYLYFEINQAAAERAGLRISSHVLNLAKPEPKS